MMAFWVRVLDSEVEYLNPDTAAYVDLESTWDDGGQPVPAAPWPGSMANNEIDPSELPRIRVYLGLDPAPVVYLSAYERGGEG